MYLGSLDNCMPISQQLWGRKIKWLLGHWAIREPHFTHHKVHPWGKRAACLHCWWLSRSLGSVGPEEMDSPEAGKPKHNICEKHSSRFFWLTSHRTLYISNHSKPVNQEPAREQGKGAKSLVLSRRVPGGLPRNREIREVSKQADRGSGNCLSETFKMFSAECFHSDTSTVLG